MTVFGVEGWPACGTPAEALRLPRARRRLARRSHRAGAARPRGLVTPVWLVLPDPFSSRLFFDTGIVERLARAARRPARARSSRRGRAGRPPGASASEAHASSSREELMSRRAGRPRSVVAACDRWLDAQDRLLSALPPPEPPARVQPRSACSAGHQNWFLDSARAGSLPRWPTLDRVHDALALRPLALRAPAAARATAARAACDRAREHADARPSSRSSSAARRIGLPVVGHIASWDHTVGKGIVSPALQRYIVQNEVMRDDLVRYHGIDPERIVVTGWPQTDVFHRRRPREEYERVVRDLGLDPARPVVLVMGNTPTNAPYERPFVERLVALVGRERRGSRFSAAVSPAPARPGMARTLRGRRSPRGGRGSGTELHRPRDARRAAAARRRRRLECGDDSPRRPGQRPARGVRALRRGRAGRRELGVEERQRRALQVS